MTNIGSLIQKANGPQIHKKIYFITSIHPLFKCEGSESLLFVCLFILFFFLFCKNYVGAVEGGGQKPKIFMMDKKSAPGGKRWRTEAKMFSSSR